MGCKRTSGGGHGASSGLSIAARTPRSSRVAAARGRGGRGRCPSPGGGVVTGALASSCALLTLSPPQPLPRRGCCRVRSPSSPASGCVWLGYFLAHTQASESDRVWPSHSPCLRPSLCSAPVDAVVLQSGLGCILGRSVPARNAPLQSWPPGRDRHPSSGLWVLSALITESNFLRLG